MTDQLPDLPPELPFPPQRLEQRRAALVRELSRPRRRVWRRPMLLLPLGAVLVAGGAAAAGLFGNPLSEPDRVQCYADANLGARHTEALTNSGPVDAGPRALCSLFFERGFLAPAGSKPELVACFDGGVVRVFPGSATTCSELKLKPISDAAYTAERDRLRKAFEVADVQIAVFGGATVTGVAPDVVNAIDYERKTECPHPAESARVILAALARAAMSEFRVVADPRMNASDCVSAVTVPDRFDGRTIELTNPELLGVRRLPSIEEAVGMDRANDRIVKERCGNGLGRRGAEAASDVFFVLECDIERRMKALPPDRDPVETRCYTGEQLRSLVERTLANEGLSDWRVVIDGGPAPGAKVDLGYYVGPPFVDRRIRQVRLRLSKSCLDRGMSAPRE